jgi:hypothetical protein
MVWFRQGTERIDVERGRAVRAACRVVEPLPVAAPEGTEVDLVEWVRDFLDAPVSGGALLSFREVDPTVVEWGL